MEYIFFQELWGERGVALIAHFFQWFISFLIYLFLCKFFENYIFGELFSRVTRQPMPLNSI